METPSAKISLRIDRELAKLIAKEFEARRITISAGIAEGIAMWLDAIKEYELAAVMRDGRGLIPRQPLRHKAPALKGQGRKAGTP